MSNFRRLRRRLAQANPTSELVGALPTLDTSRVGRINGYRCDHCAGYRTRRDRSVSRRNGVYATERVLVADDGPTQRVITVEVRAFWPPGTPWEQVLAAMVKAFCRARRDAAGKCPDAPEVELR
jgi:hypothetical protein